LPDSTTSVPQDTDSPTLPDFNASMQQDTNLPTLPDSTAPRHHGTAAPPPKSLDIGINITPDMVFYSNSSGSFKYNYTFDLGARYNLGRFYIQSGVGLIYSSDIGDYAISYLNNDSVGFYYTINSYTVDPGNPDIPLFDMKQVTVYDSIQHLSDQSTKNTYYYIQIPLTAGYRIINKPAWRLSVEAGLFYTWLVLINEPEPTFYTPEGRILDIERQSPRRNTHSLGLTGGISVEYQFARNFFLLVEPTVKYYMQAIEENSSRGDKQPYSIGLRAGIWYRLHFKNKTK
ncbi:MAG: outer membrane beta-barrel protein, partial [Bacteroidales bacterium]|nr:outer membrane beta-barrel protein [Bacteroidales bacterium]